MQHRPPSSRLLPFLALPLLLASTVCWAGPDARGFLYGRITTVGGESLEGFLRWGDQEHFWDDLFHSAKTDLPFLEEIARRERADASDRDGRRETVFGLRIHGSEDAFNGSRIFIARFGDIDRIVVEGEQAATVHLRSGSAFEVEGYSDDVGTDLQLTPAGGGPRIVPWSELRSIEFEAVPTGADPGIRRLHGRVETDIGVFEGWIMWDRQECVSTDELDGKTREGDRSLQMGRIRSIERRGRSSSIVELTDGQRLRLRGTNDVDADNRGVMIEDPRFGRVTVDWMDFDRVIFDVREDSGPGYEDFVTPGALTGELVDGEGEKFRGRIVFDLDEAEGWEMLNGRIRDVDFDIPLQRIREIEPLDAIGCRVTLDNGEVLELGGTQDVTGRNDGVLVSTGEEGDGVYRSWDTVRLLRFGP